MEGYVYTGKKYLRCGYTTGSCAAGAAKAGIKALLSGQDEKRVTIRVPKGTELTLEIAEKEVGAGIARCGIRKDSGDDPDITNGILIIAEVELKEGNGIQIDGGIGVGRVTKAGMGIAVGEAAINPVPRMMIEQEVASVCAEYGYSAGVSVVITIPEGVELAKKTFNPKLGIVGGLSVLGTSGIVEPMSNKAVIDSIKLELDVLKAAGYTTVMLVIGNYGEAFVRSVLKNEPKATIKCSNFLGDAIDAAVVSGFSKILLVGHAGKMVKLGIGITNTHSSNGDGRIETLIACALTAGTELEVLRKLSDCVTTDAAIEVLNEAGILEATMRELSTRIEQTLERKVPETVEIGYICFLGERVLTKSKNAEELRWCIL